MTKQKRKAKTKNNTEIPEDATWCKKNAITLKPGNYFKKFGVSDRRKGHQRYKRILTTYIQKNHKKRLLSEFETWRSGLESTNFWTGQVMVKSRADANYKATKFATRNTQQVYDEMNAVSLNEEQDSELEAEIMDAFASDRDLSSEGPGYESNVEELANESDAEDRINESDREVRGNESDAEERELKQYSSFLSEDQHPDAESYYWCLNGEGLESWSPQSSSDWILNGNNITEALKEIRKESMYAALNIERISSLRILALSHIFPISPIIDQSITNLILTLHDDLLQETDFFLRVETPIEAVTWAHRLHEVQSGDMEPVLSNMKRLPLGSDQGLLREHISFLEDFTRFYRDPHPNDTEDSALDRLKMILQHVFYDKKYIVNSNTKHLESAKDYIPDYKLSYPIRSTKLMDLFIVEVKLTNKSYFPHQDDFIKLRLEMQKMLNSLIFINVPEPIVFGLLLKGLNCQLYAMWLEYDGVYVCRELQSFSLPRSVYEIMLCPSILSTVISLKEKINELIKRILARPKANSRLVGLTRKGYDSPILVKDPLAFSIQN